MNKRKQILIAISIILLGLIIAGGSYAYFTWNSNVSKNIIFNTASNLKDYIVYDEGNSNFVGDFNVSNSYNQGMHSTISLYKTQEAANVNLLATIHMDVNQIGENMKKSSALKWVVTKGTSSNIQGILAQGNFIGTNNGDTLTLVPNIEVTTTETFYTIWIWLDAAENPSDLLSGETLDTNVWTEINQLEGTEDRFEITRINANYQTISATVVDNKYKVTNYAVTTSNTTPSTWESIAQANQSNVYNLTHTVSETGTYYVWFKDSNNRTTSKSIQVTTLDNTPPTCTWGSFSPVQIANNETSSITLTCTDTESELSINNLTTESITKSNNNVTVTNVTKTSVTNGYKYTVTVKGTETDGTTTLTLPANSVKNATGLGNAVATSSSITIANQYTVKFAAGDNNCTLNSTTYADKTPTYGQVFNIANPTCTGYTFTGWTANNTLDTTNAKYGTSSNAVTTAWSNASTKVTATYFKDLAQTSSKTVTLTATWSADALTFNNQTLNNGTYGSSYTSNAFTGASNGTGSYTYTIASGAPTGATINSNNRTISFTNTTNAGTYSVVVTATDNNSGVTKNATMTIVIDRQGIAFPTCSSKVYTASEQTLFEAHTSGQYTNSAIKGTNVGSYTGDLTPTANYKWNSGSNVTSARILTCSITKADTTTTMSAITKTYNGSNQAASGASAKLNSNNSTISGASFTYAYYSGTGCSGTALSAAPKDAGTYSVKATLTGTDNYNTSTSSCVAYTMNKKALTSTQITAYETGWVSGATTYTRSVSTGVGSETVSLTYTPYANSVGTYTYTATAAAGKFTLSQSNNNYSISSAGDLTLTSATITGSVTISGTATWGQTLTANPTCTVPSSGCTFGSYQWYSNGTAISGATSSTYVIPKEQVGKTITVSVVASATNYANKTLTSSATSAIAKQNLSVTRTNYSGAYDGSAHGVIVKVTSTNWDGKTIVSGTTTSYGTTVTSNGAVNTNYTLSPTYTAVTSAKTVYYKVTGGTYYNDATGSGTVTITQKKGTITLTDSTKALTYKTSGTNAYTYDGDGTVSCSSSDSTYVTCSVDTTNHKINVVPVKATSTAITITVSASAGTNYSAADNKTFTVTVAKFTPTVSLSAKTEAQRTFTGSAIAANTATVTLTNSETYSGTITYTYYTNDACSAGSTTTAPTSGNYWVKASIAAQGNYNAASSSCVNHNIVAATPTVSLSAKSNMVYNGSAQTANTATVSPNGGGAITYTYYTNDACSAGSTTAAPTNAGSYWVKASVAAVSGKTNAASSSCVAHTIGKKALTSTQITAYSATWVSGATTYTRSDVATGVGSETVSLTYTPYANGVGTYTYTATAAAGKFTLSQSNNNYSISSAGDLTLTSAVITGSVTISGTATWGQTLTANPSCTVPSSGCTFGSYQWYSNGTAISGATSSTYVIPKEQVGKTITVSVVASATNYANKTLTSSATSAIAKQNLSVTRTNYSGAYDGSAHGVIVKVTSASWDGKTIVSGTTTSYGTTVTSNGAVNTNYTLSPTYTAVTSAKTVYYKVTGGTYYNDATGSGTVTITQKKGTITLTDSTKALTYKTSGTNAYTYDGDGTVSCASSDSTYVTCSVDVTNHKINVVPVKATSTAITITVSASAGTNYSAADNKTFTVTVAKFTPTVSLSAKTEAQRTFTGSAIAANTATVTLTNSETYSGTITYTYYTNDACSAGSTTTAPTFGNYWVKASIAAQGNYNAASSSCVNHNIVAATPTVSLSAKSNMVYNGSAQTANTATVSPNGGGAITYTYYTNDACSAGSTTTAPTNAGSYWVKASVAAVSGKTNAASSSCVAHTIGKKALTSTQITAYSATWVSGATTYTRSVSTGVGSETVSLTYTPYANGVGTYTYTTTAAAGKFTLSQSNNNYSISSAGDLTISAAICNPPTNVSISTAGIVTWTASSNATSYQIGMTSNPSTTAVSGVNYLNTITSSAGNKTVYVRSVCGGNYAANSSNATATTTVYSVSLTKGTGIGSVTGAGNYITGATVNIDATVNTGYTWYNWTQTSGGASVSTTKAYSQVIQNNISYTANARDVTGPTAVLGISYVDPYLSAAITNFNDTGSGINPVVNWKISTSSVCDDTTTGFTSHESLSHVQEVDGVSVYYVCVKIEDLAGNATYLQSASAYQLFNSSNSLVGYENTLGNAFSNVPSGGTIKPLYSNTTSGGRNLKNATLNTNGKSIVLTSPIILSENNLSINGGGDISASEDTNCIVGFGGNLNISNVDLESIDSATISLDSGAVTMSGGSINASSSFAIYQEGGTFNMNGGTISSTADVSMINENGGIFNLSGGTLNATSAAAIDVSSGTVNVTDGTYSSTRTSGQFVLVEDTGEFNISGGSISTVNMPLKVTGGIARITGGELSTSNSDSISQTGGIINMSGGTVSSTASYVMIYENGGTFNLSGGTLNTTTTTAITANAGTVNITNGTYTSTKASGQFISVQNTGELNISGGSISTVNMPLKVTAGTAEITGGSLTTSDSNAINQTGGIINISGGTISSTATYAMIYENGGTLNLSGGILTTTTASAIVSNAGTVNITDGTYTTGKSSGKFIGVQNTGEVNISGGTITPPATTNAISVINGTLNITNGTIQSNAAYAINQTGGIIDMRGGSISSSESSPIYLNGGTFNLRGGTIPHTGSSAYFYVDNGILNIIDGTYNCTANTNFVQMYDGTTNAIGGTINSLENNSNIGIHSKGGTLNFSGTTINTGNIGIYIDGGTAYITGGTINVVDSGIAMQQDDGTINMSGGNLSCNHDAFYIGMLGGVFNLSGGTFLSNDVTSIFNVSGGTLNVIDGSYSLDGSDKKVILVSSGTISNTYQGQTEITNVTGTVNITGGTITSSDGSALYVRNGTVTMSGGTVASADYCSMIVLDGSVYINGGTISTENGSAINQDGGTINMSGGIASSTGVNPLIYVSDGIFNLSGGALNPTNGIALIAGGGVTNITDGAYSTSRTDGQFLEVKDTGELNISGGSISTMGANPLLVLNGTVNITGGSLNTSRGNTVRQEAGIINMSGGTISSTDTYAMVYEDGGTFNLRGGTFDTTTATAIAVNSGTFNIIDGTYTSARTSGQFIGVRNTGKLNISGGSITTTNLVLSVTGGIVDITGGSLNVSATTAIDQKAGIINMSGGTISSSANYVILHERGGTFNLSGGALNITLATAILVDSGTVNITDGTYTSAMTTGTFIHTMYTGELNITGGSISTSGAYVVAAEGGVVNLRGGSFDNSVGNAIFQADGIVNMSGGTITSSNSYAMAFITGGTYNLSGGTFDTTTGVPIYATAGTVNITDGSYTLTSSGQFAYITDTADLNITGGTISTTAAIPLRIAGGTVDITGGSLTTSDSNAINQTGGIINMSSGTVSSTSTYAMIYENGGTFNLSGGTLSTTTATAIFVNAGIFNITQGNYTSEKTSGRFISVKNTGKLNISGGSISSVCSSLEVSAGTVDITGGTITTSGGDTINHFGGTINMSGGTVSSTATYAMIYENGGTFNLSGGILSTTTTTALAINSGTVNITDGIYTSAKTSGQFISVQNTGELNMSGGSISAASVVPLRVAGGTAYITGGTLSSSGTNTIYQIAGVVNMSGGTISSTATTSTMIYDDGGTFNLSGGTLSTTTTTALVVNSGIVNITNGTYTFPSTGKISIGVVNTGELNISGGTLNSATMLIQQSGGTVNVTGGTLLNTGNYSLITVTGGVFNQKGGTLNPNIGYVFDVTGGTLNIISGTYTYPSTCQGAFLFASGGTTNISGGSVTVGEANALVFQSNSTGNMTNGTISNSSTGYATIYVDTGATFVKTGGTVSGHGIYAASGSTCTGC